MTCKFSLIIHHTLDRKFYKKNLFNSMYEVIAIPRAIVYGLSIFYVGVIIEYNIIMRINWSINLTYNTLIYDCYFFLYVISSIPRYYNSTYYICVKQKLHYFKTYH